MLNTLLFVVVVAVEMTFAQTNQKTCLDVFQTVGNHLISDGICFDKTGGPIGIRKETAMGEFVACRFRKLCTGNSSVADVVAPAAYTRFIDFSLRNCAPKDTEYQNQETCDLVADSVKRLCRPTTCHASNDTVQANEGTWCLLETACNFILNEYALHCTQIVEEDLPKAFAALNDCDVPIASLVNTDNDLNFTDASPERLTNGSVGILPVAYNKLRQPCSAGSIGCLCLIPAADGAEDKVITAGNDGICALHGVCNEDGFCEVDKKDVAISLATKIGIGLIFVGFHIVLNVF